MEKHNKNYSKNQEYNRRQQECGGERHSNNNQRNNSQQYSGERSQNYKRNSNQSQQNQSNNNNNNQMGSRRDNQPKFPNDRNKQKYHKNSNKFVNKIDAVLTNYVDLSLDKMEDYIYHYDIRIEHTVTEHTKKRENSKIKFTKEIFELLRLKHWKDTLMAYDGINNVFSPRNLNLLKEITEEILYENKSYNVTFKETKDYAISLKELKLYALNPKQVKIDDIPKNAIQAIDIIFKTSLNDKQTIPTETENEIGKIYHLKKMLYQSFVIGTKIYLNVDIKIWPFTIEMNLIDVLKKFNINIQNYWDSKFYEIDHLNKELNNLKIRYNGPKNIKKIYTFDRLSKKSTKEEQFMLEDGKKTNVFNYFKDHHGLTLVYSNLPCLKIKNRDVYLPLELCFIKSNQKMSNTSKYADEIVRHCDRNTDERIKNITESLKYVNFNGNPIIKTFGIDVGNIFKRIPAKLLPSPTLNYKNKKETIFKGEWKAENCQFIDGKSLDNWVILKFNQNVCDNDIEKFAKRIILYGKQKNMEINQPDRESINSKNLEETFKNYKKRDVKLVVVIIPRNDKNDTYPISKIISELKVGVLTQCFREQTIKYDDYKFNPVINNLLLKINAKLNGTNHTIDLIPKNNFSNFMFLGGDVTHPKKSSNHPSVVGFVASYDCNGFKYKSEHRYQTGGMEIIEDLESILINQLCFYKEDNKKLPEKIYYFRDGVSDGEFEKILEKELTSIKLACKKMKCDPKISIIIVNKRHHTRLFPENDNCAIGNNKNVPPGTTVDSDITNPKYDHKQSYIVSHIAIKGVARPTKYTILHDENNVQENDFQILINNLCSMYARCNRSVSYVTPTYYAHHAATRGKVYISTAPDSDLKDMKKLKEKYEKTEISKNNPMYFI